MPRAATVTPFPRKPPLHQGLLEAIRALIDRGDLAAGARVPERALCERFDVSRTPLRECLKVLAAEGLVELLPNRGARIATLDGGHLAHLFEVVAALEAEAGRLACARIAPAEIAEIQALHHKMHAHFLRGELPGYFAQNQAIHTAILNASRNPVLMATHHGLAGRITRAHCLSNRMRPDLWRRAMEEHDAILATLLERDGPRLAALLSQHLRNKRDIVIADLCCAR